MLDAVNVCTHASFVDEPRVVLLRSNLLQGCRAREALQGHHLQKVKIELAPRMSCHHSPVARISHSHATTDLANLLCLAARLRSFGSALLRHLSEMTFLP